jgi:hypothetical protein
VGLRARKLPGITAKSLITREKIRSPNRLGGQF